MGGKFRGGGTTDHVIYFQVAAQFEYQSAEVMSCSFVLVGDDLRNGTGLGPTGYPVLPLGHGRCRFFVLDGFIMFARCGLERSDYHY